MDIKETVFVVFGTIALCIPAVIVWGLPMYLMRKKPLLKRVLLTLFFGPFITIGYLIAHSNPVVVMNPEDFKNPPEK